MIQFEQPLTGDIEFGRLLIRQLHHLKKHLTHPLEIPDTAQTDPLILQIVQLALAQLLRFGQAALRPVPQRRMRRELLQIVDHLPVAVDRIAKVGRPRFPVGVEILRLGETGRRLPLPLNSTYFAALAKSEIV